MTHDESFKNQFFIRQSLIIVLLCIVFLTDLLTQLGFSHGILYLPVLILAMRLRGMTALFQASVLCLSQAGIIIGYFLAPETAENFPMYYVIANRVLSAAALFFSFFALKQNLVMKVRFSEIEQKEEYQREYLQYFIDSMPIQIWSANPAGEIDFVSGRLEEFIGKNQKEILADWSALLHPEDRERTLDTWTRSVANNTPYQIDFRLRRHDGAFIWFQTQATPIRDSQGNIIRWLGSSIDIDNLRNLQEESEQLAKRLQHTLESITDAFFTLDKSFRFTYINQKAADILGGTVDDFLGKVIWEQCPIGYNGPFANMYRRAAEYQEKIHFEEYFEPGDQWLEVHIYPSSEGLTVYFSDVTMQRQEKEQLKLLSSAVARLNDIILITEAEPIDEPGPKIVFVNDAFEKRTGYTREEVIGASPRILQGPNTNRKELDRIRMALKKWKPVRAQLINYTKNGNEFWLELDIVPLTNKSGWYTHWVAVERDITEQKAMQEKLANSQKMESVGQLTGGISHDFNNLLTVILGNAELLKEELEDNDKLSSLASLICQAAEKGAALTRNLLAFARRQPLSPQVVAVRDLLTDMYPILKSSLGERNQLDINISQNLWDVFVDPAQLESAILNLAINAHDAMPEGGIVKIFTKNYVVEESEATQDPDLLPGQYVQITLTDNGEGMPLDLQKRIFEPFFSTKPETKGSGLGLSMIYGFLRQSQGTVTVYSELGLGTAFNLYLPRADVPTHDSLKENESTGLTFKRQEASILVVEDNPDIRALAENSLSHHGFQVFSAASGDEALSLIENGLQTDLLFTDVVMPGSLSGPELANIAVNKMPSLRVILTSGFADLGSEYPALGESHILLPKPYKSSELIGLIRDTLSLNPSHPRKLAVKK